jgi:CheY-like chemotaxis protein
MSHDHPGRVLVVDDELLVREMLRDFLPTVGDEVATAASGAEALEMVRTFRPDVRSALGLVVSGLARQGWDLQLTAYDDSHGRTTFYVSGMAHSIVGGSA